MVEVGLFDYSSLAWRVPWALGKEAAEGGRVNLISKRRTPPSKGPRRRLTVTESQPARS